MAEEQPTLFETVKSYIPGFAGGTAGATIHDEHHKEDSSSHHEEHHENVDPGAVDKLSIQDHTRPTETGKSSSVKHDPKHDTHSGAGLSGGNRPAHQYGLGSGLADKAGTDFGHASGRGSDGHRVSSDTGSQATGVSGGSSSAVTGSGSGGTYSDYARDHPETKPDSGSGADRVRGAPIEGENVKGYAIGAPVGSGDTENPAHPGDPSGQVSGSHLEYGPEDTDTRDRRGRGTVGTTKGESDSSFANVKRDDGAGNSEHVVTRSSTSTMKSTTTTQL